MRCAAIFSVAFVVMNLITSEFLPVSLLTPIARDLGVSAGAAGQMISVTSVAAVVTSLLTAPLSRRLDRRAVLLGASGALILSNLLVAVAPGLTVVLLARLLLGLAMGGFWSLSNAVTLRLTPQAQLPGALAVTSGGVALANVLAPPLGSVLGEAVGWRGVFVAAALLGAAGLVWQWRALPLLPPGSTARLGTLGRLLRRPQVRASVLALVLTFGGYMLFFAYLRPYLEQVTGLGVGPLSAVLLSIGVAGVAGTAVSGRLLTWSLRRTHILVPLVTGVLVLVLLAVGRLPVWTAGVLTLLSLVNSVLPVAWGNWLAVAVPDEAESAGGLQIAAIQSGMTLGAVAGGVVLSSGSPAALPLLSGAALLLGAVVIWKGLNHQPTRPA